MELHFSLICHWISDEDLTFLARFLQLDDDSLISRSVEAVRHRQCTRRVAPRTLRKQHSLIRHQRHDTPLSSRRLPKGLPYTLRMDLYSNMIDKLAQSPPWSEEDEQVNSLSLNFVPHLTQNAQGPHRTILIYHCVPWEGDQEQDDRSVQSLAQCAPRKALRHLEGRQHAA